MIAFILTLTAALAEPARAAGGLRRVMPRVQTFLADARTDVRARPFVMRILVMPFINWTSLWLMICAGRWVLAVLARSTRPIRGRVLGSFLKDFLDAELPAGVCVALRLPRRVPIPVPRHPGPDGQRGGVAPIAREEPRSAATTPRGEAARAVPPLFTCAAPSPTSSFKWLGPRPSPGAMPYGDIPLASGREPPGGDRWPRVHPQARAAGRRLPAPACNGPTCVPASGEASPQGGGRSTRGGQEARGAGSGLSLSTVLLPTRSGEGEKPVPRRREVVGGVGVVELLVASTSATTSTPPPRSMDRTRASGVVVLELAVVSASAITSTLPGLGAKPLGGEQCEVDVADVPLVATFASTPTSQTADDAPTARRVSCVAIALLVHVSTATHDPQMTCTDSYTPPVMGRRFVEEDGW